jgi:4'-phosphopantetheinyl transferase
MLLIYYQFVLDGIIPVYLANLTSELPYNKQIRLNKLVKSKDKCLSLAGLQLLKIGMQDLGFKDFNLSTVQFDRLGKPICEQDVDFSISHSGNLVLCAISLGGKVGIDVEYTKSSSRHNRQELDQWTRDEAVLKAHGQSDLSKSGEIQWQGHKAQFLGEQWVLHSLRAHPDYVVHVATDVLYARVVAQQFMVQEGIVDELLVQPQLFTTGLSPVFDYFDFFDFFEMKKKKKKKKRLMCDASV